ncbi:superoxide dismutase [Oceanibacterium hippocampi]|uniref:Superoxide dismutase n=1 Tax=Oceanibacterium hippocampi TaxID=745714 RepID=A0A1Y5U185_9PROT|nr:superoxide dismutase [Oceanibacterium hippocampi]SLN73787.1 Superoxide dismutase [Fe] [Oceanibacterium hippocampi]
MTFELPDLPYSKDALAPHMSAETLSFHHDKHQKSYVEKLNSAVNGTEFAGKSLEEIIRATAGKSGESGIFNNAAQTWNHTFFWHSMSPKGGGAPDGALARQIDRDFGGFDKFRSEFLEKGKGQFGSGWVWLVLANGKLEVVSTGNADTPIAHDSQPLLTCDVWEHAYYLDYQNRRPDYLESFLDNLANWAFAAEEFANQGEGSRTAARRYQDAQADYARSGKADDAGRAAQQALDGSEGKSLEEARRKTAGSSG